MSCVTGVQTCALPISLDAATCSIDPAAGSGALLVDYLITGDNQKAIAILEAKIAEKKRHIGAYYTPQAVKDHMEQIQSNEKSAGTDASEKTL